MINELKKQVRYFINNKLYMLSLILAAIAGYGYEITHSSMGIDDVCIELYFDDGLGVAIGRWPFYLINKVFHVTDFEPFILEAVAVLFMILAAILWSVVVRSVISKKIPVACYTIFASMFLCYSLIAEVFIYYLQNGVALIYCLTALSLYVFYYMETHELSLKKKRVYMTAISVMVCLAAGFYESAINLFLFAVLLLMVADASFENRMGLNKFKNCFFTGFRMVRILLYAIVGRSWMTKLCMAIFGIESYSYRSVRSMLWILEYPGRIITIIKQILRDYVVVGTDYYPIGLFVAATVVYLIFVIVAAIKKKNGYLFLLGMMSYASIFALSIAQGDAVPYRANQMLSVFVACVLFAVSILVAHIPQMFFRGAGWLLIISIVYNSAFDLNHWFAYEYKKNQAELEDVHRISFDLRSGGYDIANKPVVFVGKYELDAYFLRECSMNSDSKGYSLVRRLNSSMGVETPEYYSYVQMLSYSLIDWAIPGFWKYEGYNRELIRLFEKEGCTLIWGGNALYEDAMNYIEDLERYPKTGYIKEYEDYIVVRF